MSAHTAENPKTFTWQTKTTSESWTGSKPNVMLAAKSTSSLRLRQPRRLPRWSGNSRRWNRLVAEGELKKRSKSVNQIRNEFPEIIRTKEKIDETIKARIDAQYFTNYVAVSDVDEAKKDFPTLKDVHLTDAEKELAGAEYIELAHLRLEWKRKWFGGSS